MHLLIFRLLNARLKIEVNGLKTDVNDLKTDGNNLKTEIKSIKEIVVRIENDHGSKINALFDGHLQNKEKIEEHEQILGNR